MHTVIINHNCMCIFPHLFNVSVRDSRGKESKWEREIKREKGVPVRDLVVLDKAVMVVPSTPTICRWELPGCAGMKTWKLLVTWWAAYVCQLPLKPTQMVRLQSLPQTLQKHCLIRFTTTFHIIFAISLPFLPLFPTLLWYTVLIPLIAFILWFSLSSCAFPSVLSSEGCFEVFLFGLISLDDAPWMDWNTLTVMGKRNVLVHFWVYIDADLWWLVGVNRTV